MIVQINVHIFFCISKDREQVELTTELIKEFRLIRIASIHLSVLYSVDQAQEQWGLMENNKSTDYISKMIGEPAPTWGYEAALSSRPWNLNHKGTDKNNCYLEN